LTEEETSAGEGSGEVDEDREALRAELGDDLLDFRRVHPESADEQLWLTVPARAAVRAAGLLRNQGFSYFSYAAAVDYLEREPRFEVVYSVVDLSKRRRAQLKVVAEEGEPPTVPSLSYVWKGADWHEREAFDLMGIHFSGHPDLRRIAMPDEWSGHPQRKDYVISELVLPRPGPG
jgi:NADH-quinone oxidoreductase subunit C